MRHDTAMPRGLHDEAAASVKEALGAFWSSVFRDQDLVDALLLARVLSAGQVHVDVMEALSLRDHSGSPVLHREHWHPLLVRLSKRNTASAVTVGMPDTPVLGPQDDSGEVYLPGEVFVVGGNALYSKVNTYPIEGLGGCSLVRVATALCDSVSAPRHVLSQGRDFALVDGVLAIRKEQDPFDTEGYLVEEDGDDRVAVLWACDAEFDRDHVSDFVGYPLGIHAPSTEASSQMLSTLWDVVTLGLTPVSLNKVLGAVFDVPVVGRATVVEAVVDDGDFEPAKYAPWAFFANDGTPLTDSEEEASISSITYADGEWTVVMLRSSTPHEPIVGTVSGDADATELDVSLGNDDVFGIGIHAKRGLISPARPAKLVVTRDSVYRLAADRLAKDRIVPGAELEAGSFLTDEIAVYWGLSADDIAGLLADGRLGRVALPPGSVAGVDETVVIEPGVRMMEDGGWFKLNDGDSADSPFWRAVFARTTQGEREALFSAMADGGTTVDPFAALGPVVLSNLILVRTARSPVADACSGAALALLRRLVPSFASLLVVQEVEAGRADGLDGADEVGMDDAADYKMVHEGAYSVSTSIMEAGSDDVVFTFVPSAATEV